MNKTINVIIAAALVAAALASAASLARLSAGPEKGALKVCAERFCGVVFF